MANLRANKITSTEVFETTGSVQFTGTTSALAVPAGTDFAYGTGTFTIECFIYAPTLAATPGASYADHNIFSQTVSGTNYLMLSYDPNGTLYWTNATSGGGTVVTTSSGVVVANKWQHIVASRDSNNILRMFVDGSVVYSGYNNFDFNDTTRNPTIGNYTHIYSQLPFTGHISNFRILKGTALYTKNFTPPTRELTVIPNTVLLACTSTTNTAQEATGKTITVNGNAVANELTPGLLTDVVKSGGTSAITGSVEFGESDYLSLASSSDFNLGTGDFTIEFWIHPQKRFTSYPTIFQINATNAANVLVINFRNTSTLGLTNGNTVFATNTGFNLDSWFHVAIVRQSGVSKIYKNGISGGDTACTEDFSNSGSSNISIGWDSTIVSSEKYNGFISNLRVLKGTALYTGSFTPPSRELKKIPNTVLLCCKNSSDPTAEETGKTITPYGSLVYNPPELVNDGAFNSASSWPSAQADWSISGGKATINSANSGYDYLGILTSRTINGLLYELRFDISSWTAGRLELAQSDSSNIGVTVSGNGSYSTRFRYTGTTNGNISLYSYTDTTASFALDNLSLKQVASVPSPAFTPQIGSDGSVTFDGVTKINTQNYFYLPTGNTENRGRGRGVFTISSGTPANSNAINYLQISSSGNSIDFGDLTSVSGSAGSVSSSTRMIIALANNSPVTASPGNVNTLDYLTIATTSNTLDFGDLTTKRAEIPGVSNSTRGVFIGGFNELVSPYSGPTISYTNTMDYISIASLGNALDFGDSHSDKSSHNSAVGNNTRGVYTVSWNGSTTVNNINYITISTTGNGQDFGDLTTPQNRQQKGSVSNSTRGLFAGGITPVTVNTIEYITITSLGNAQDFGDLSYIRRNAGGTSNSIRGVFAGGYDAPPGPLGRTNVIDYVILASTGNASDFGDLLENSLNNTGASDSHGGLS